MFSQEGVNLAGIEAFSFYITYIFFKFTFTVVCLYKNVDLMRTLPCIHFLVKMEANTVSDTNNIINKANI
jgi:hypothetical protein